MSPRALTSRSTGLPAAAGELYDESQTAWTIDQVRQAEVRANSADAIWHDAKTVLDDLDNEFCARIDPVAGS